MGKTYDQLDERLRGWIADQRLFLVATAPSGPGGHVNLSPKCHADLNSERRYRRWQAYNASKLANALFSLELDRRLRAAGAATASVGAHPGYARTGLQTTGPRLGDGRPLSIEAVSAGVVELFTRLTAQPAAQGALAVLRAATDPEVAGGDYLGPDGFGGGRGWPVKAQYSKTAQDEQMARRLWTVSERLTGVGFPALVGRR